jgi:ubiquinone/menaquinone biosynthesis C-methylase UbiE
VPDRKKHPIAQRAYNQMAELYAERVDTKPHNAFYERPATLSLLPDVVGKQVLDAGCGPGVYSEWLIDRGAQVVALDANPKMVRFAKKRLGSKARVLLASLDEPLGFLVEASFDIIVSPLVMDYVKDWCSAFTEFFRVLKPAGMLVLSIEHPYVKYDQHRQTSNYFEIDRVEFTWRGFGKPVRVPSYRRPMGEVINPLIETGFVLDKLLEPLPTAQFKQADPEEYEQLMRSPGFLCLRAIKPEQ